MDVGAKVSLPPLPAPSPPLKRRAFRVRRTRLARDTRTRYRHAMARKKISTTIYVDPEKWEQLKALSGALRIPTAVLVRDGIDAAIASAEQLVSKKSS